MFLNTVELDNSINLLKTVLLLNRGTVGIEQYSEDEVESLKVALALGTDNIKVTKRTLKNIVSYWNQLQTRPDNIPFFGGNLLGTDNIRFLSADRDWWFDEILEIDEEYLKEYVHRVPIINTDWVVTSDVFNMSIIWILNNIMTVFGDKDKLALEAMLCVIDLFQFRFLTSIYSHYFRRPVDEAAATATYAALSMKFKIRQLGTWGAVIRDRSILTLAKDSIHYNTIKTLEPDESVMYFITDMSTRTRKTIKDQYGVLDKIRAGNLRVQSSSATIELDGERIIRDKINSYSTARNYLIDVSGNQASFIKNELTNIITDIMTTVSEQVFNEALVVIANLPAGAERDKIEWCMDNTLMYSFDYITENRIRFNDIAFIITKMRSMFMSSKSPSPILHKLREDLEAFSVKHTKLRSPAALAAMRTSIMLYFLLRALSYNSYR